MVDQREVAGGVAGKDYGGQHIDDLAQEGPLMLKLTLHTLALADFVVQAAVGSGKRSRALVDTLVLLVLHAPKLGLKAFAFGNFGLERAAQNIFSYATSGCIRGRHFGMVRQCFLGFAV
jgi:hypothetical protein